MRSTAPGTRRATRHPPAGAGLIATVPVKARCENWGAWQRGGAEPAAARSFEGQYRSPQPWEPYVPTMSSAVDPVDARIVEDAVCLTPVYHHAILRTWYVRQWPPARCLRVAAKAAGWGRGRTSGFERTLDMAHALLHDALLVPSCVRRSRLRDLVIASITIDADEDYLLP